jgi:predicted ATPase/regulation of enolase protein 1 (concanavalin A-like superfamily)
VRQAVATALALQEEPGKPLLDTLVECLRPRELLLILDNCEHLLAACAHLVHTVVRFCPNVRILTTSRERLKIQGEQLYRVPSLSAPNPRDLPATLVGTDLVSALNEYEAVQMFVDRAKLVQPSFALTPENAALVAQVCHRLDGIPLAIELAAARLHLLSVQQIAELEDRFRLLSSQSDVAPRRQQTLRALIDWSYDLLSETEQSLLRRLSVFAGGFTLPAAEAVCAGEGIESDAVLDLLGRLMDTSLVLVDEQEEERRYRLLDTIRQYASEKLWEAEEGAVARWRYRRWCLRLAERALSALSSPERAVWLQRLVREYDNLRAALGPAARTHSPGRTGEARQDLPLFSWRLAQWGQVLEPLVLAFRHLSRSEVALGILEDYIGLCQTEGDARWLARAYTLMALFLRLNPHLAGRETSRSMFERAIAVCEAHGLDDWVAYPRARLAHDLAMDAADLEQAEALARACPPDADISRDVQWMVSGKTTLAPTLYSALMWVATHRGDWAALRDAFEKSLAWGGPSRTPLLEMLTRIEENCHRQGTDATFRDLCRFMADGYARAGLPAPLQQWYLEPTVPQPLPGEPWLREEFAGEDCHSSLRWQDATGRSRVDRAARPGWLALYPAEGSDLWPEKDLNAPRLVTTVRGDFVAQTRVELGRDTSTLAGLLVWRDEQHFARMELQSRRAGWDRVEPVLQACVNGQFQNIGRGQCARQAMWLRLERVGEELRGLCSEDGEQWLACGVVRLPPGAAEEVGLAAIPHGSGGYAWFDTFLVWGGAPD